MVSRRLPTVRPATPGAAPAREGAKEAVEGERADVHVSGGHPERIRDGWEHRFVAAGTRADEMIALYRELGFEVVADPVPTEALIDGCTACFGTGGQEYRSIYTRRHEHARQHDRTARPDHRRQPDHIREPDHSRRPDQTRRPDDARPPDHPGRSDHTRRRDHASPRSDNVSETHPTRVLREEHLRILEVADALEGLLNVGTGGPGPTAVDRGAVDPESTDLEAPDTHALRSVEVDFDRLGKCIRFIRLFADACHHGKEEDLLFPALQEQGLPRDSGPIAVMLHEHRLGRRFASTMAENLDSARDGDADAWSRVERAGRDYVGLIRGHILKEDNVLFGMADQLVAGPACTKLCAAYDGTADRTFEGCTKAELEALGREIVEGV